MRQTYTTDLSDADWNRLRSCLPTPKAEGRPRIHSLRDVLDAIFYVLKSGCHWRLLPHDFPPWSTVYYHFRRFRLSGVWGLIYKILRGAERNRVGKKPDASAAMMDSQRASKPPRRGPHRTATTLTRTSRGASGIFW
jgi:putative transposase